MSSREARVKIAEETMQISKEGKYVINGQEVHLQPLAETRVYDDPYFETLKDLPKAPNAHVYVHASCVVEEALSHPGKRVGVLVFASAKHPGGGFTTGALAQEEKICYCSNLYTSQIQKQSEFYITDKQQFYTNRIMVSDNEVFRDTNYKLLAQPVPVTFITCAAINQTLLKTEADKQKGNQIFAQRINNIMKVITSLNLDVAVLGAFGCGVFGNDPSEVVRMFQSELKAGLGAQEVVFAVMRAGRKDANYMPFAQAFGEQ